MINLAALCLLLSSTTSAINLSLYSINQQIDGRINGIEDGLLPTVVPNTHVDNMFHNSDIELNSALK